MYFKDTYYNNGNFHYLHYYTLTVPVEPSQPGCMEEEETVNWGYSFE